MGKLMSGRRSKPDSLFVNIMDIANYISRSWLVASNLTKSEDFPRPIKIGSRSYWSKEEVVNYLTKR
jgi:predicted DNA-binding transcriptional regulator AlpA